MISDAAKQFHELLAAVPVVETTPTKESVIASRVSSEAWAIARGEPEGVTYQPVDADGVAAAGTTPAGAESNRVLLYLRGGGYTVGSIASHRKLVGHLAKAAGMRGLSVEYRMAPENPFPAGLDDAVTGFSWLLRAGDEAGRTGV